MEQEKNNEVDCLEFSNHAMYYQQRKIVYDINLISFMNTENEMTRSLFVIKIKSRFGFIYH